jgi:hypothetical protein
LFCHIKKHAFFSKACLQLYFAAVHSHLADIYLSQPRARISSKQFISGPPHPKSLVLSFSLAQLNTLLETLDK